MKIAVLIEGGSIARWQAQALERLGTGHGFTVYNCVNGHPAKRRLKNSLYYALNLLSLRNRLTSRVALPSFLPIENRIDFECEYEGAWQRLPLALLETILAEGPGCILKLGMGLLRVPADDELPCPILSYHHGDPREFRGRPAGFYEMLQGRPTVGQVVQRLSNRLDAGPVLAFAETKVYPHSYRKTMIEAFAASPVLLPRAVQNAVGGRTLPMQAAGRNYRLPSNTTVLRFLGQRCWAFARLAAYGLFTEKAWEVAEASGSAEAILDGGFADLSSWRTVARPKGYRFLADPFPSPDGQGFLVEALAARTGFGEILHVGAGKPRVLLHGKRHYSYPSTLRVDGRPMVIPEICEWSGPRLFAFDRDGLREEGRLDVPGNPRLIDPTLFERNGTTFLFANALSEGSSILRLWFADSVFDPFQEHPASPVRMSPAGSRMGGAILEANGELYRVGQDFRGQYGNGIILFRIDELSRASYLESRVREIRFDDCHGPHTLNLGERSLIFDFYRDRFSMTAGLRRIRSKLFRRFQSKADLPPPSVS